MTPRERFLRLMRYEPADRLPVLQVEPFEKPAVARWRSEGLPPDRRPEEFLQMDTLAQVGGMGIGPDPAFEVKLLEEDAEYLVETTEMGAVVRRCKASPTTFYGHVDHPVKTKADWEQYKKRFIPDSSGRKRKDLTPGRIQALNDSTDPVSLSFFPFFFRLGFYAMGMERFLTAFHDEPDLIHDMFDTASRVMQTALRPVLASIRVDFAYFSEDLAFKNGPLVSPRTYAEFWRPHQAPILRMLHEHGVPVIAHWSAGQLDALLPEILDQGFNCIGPIERIAGMDPVELRQRYGQRLRLMGGLSKEALLAGPAQIDREIDHLMPVVRQGGFIPMLDDMVPSECPFDHYRHMVKALRAVELDQAPGPDHGESPTPSHSTVTLRK